MGYNVYGSGALHGSAATVVLLDSAFYLFVYTVSRMLWFPLVSFGFLWFSLVFFGFLWFALISFGFLWVPLVSFGFVWLPLASFGFLWCYYSYYHDHHRSLVIMACT